MQKEPEIFFHAGLGKNASTYLQHRFFPKLKGIKYIHRSRYKYFRKILENPVYDKYLFSREFDRQLETETAKFASAFPNTKTIIILRRHDNWIASQYRRYIKNGGFLPFEEFIDIDKNLGLWKIEDLNFFGKIKYLEKIFKNPPLVLFHEDMKNDPCRFLTRIADYTGTYFSKEKISLKPFHKSYKPNQLKYVKKWHCRAEKGKRENFNNKIDKFISEKGRLHYNHLLLFAARLMPSGNVSDEILIPADHMEKVRKYFENDWLKCKSYNKSE